MGKLVCLSLDAQLALDKKIFVDRVINVWNALPSTVNFTSLNVFGLAMKRLIFLVFFLICL